MRHPEEIEADLVPLWDFGDPEESRRTFAARADQAEAGSPEALVLRTQLARAQGLAGAFDDALTTLDSLEGAADRLERGGSRDHVGARIAIERGRVLNSRGAPTEALPHFESAHSLALEAGTEGLAVDALHMMAIAVGQTDSPEASAGWNFLALELAEESDDPAARRWRGSLLNNLGWDRHDAGEHEEALRLFERALVVRQEAQSKPEITIASWAVARALRSLGRLGEALEIQETLAADSDNADDGFIPEEIGECLLGLGCPAEAAPHFARAATLLSQDSWLAEHEPGRLSRLHDLSA